MSDDFPTPLCGIHSQTLKGIEETCRRLEDGQKRIEKILVGNGTPGVLVEVDRLKNEVKQHSDSISESSKRSGRWFEVILSSVISIIIVGIAAACWQGFLHIVKK